jgi:hypothetical protein
MDPNEAAAGVLRRHEEERAALDRLTGDELARRTAVSR